MTAISLRVAQHTLWHFGDTNLGLEPGHFVARLLVLASAADEENLEKLSHEWPEHIRAFRAVKENPWGLDWLRALVKDELDHAERGLDFEPLSHEPGGESWALETAGIWGEA